MTGQMTFGEAIRDERTALARFATQASEARQPMLAHVQQQMAAGMTREQAWADVIARLRPSR